MRNRRYQTDAALRATERRKREDEAPRLKEEVSSLTGLRLEIEEYQGDNVILAARHTRHIVVDHAPALFEIPCSDSSCKEGGHDLTWEIMRALRAMATEFDGEDICTGQLGSGTCRRTLRYVGFATYSESPT